ncbi:MAG: class I SAM-dependent methyltransferase [Elainellaceae cyanobacterium]
MVLPAVIELLQILDLGCGTGDLAIWLFQQGYDAYGIDIAPSAIAWANEQALAQNTQVQFTVGSVLDLSPYLTDSQLRSAPAERMARSCRSMAMDISTVRQ